MRVALSVVTHSTHLWNCGSPSPLYVIHVTNVCDPSENLFLLQGLELSASLTFLRAFLVAQLVKNLPAMQETWVQSLSWEDPLEKGKVTHASILAWRIPWTV